MSKCARNPLVTDFFRSIDLSRQQHKPLFRGQRRNTRKEEPRVPHPQQQESRISARLPRSCALDWFDPEYFNDMDIEFRALYVDAPIALPLREYCGIPAPDWKNMPDDNFMEKYGNEVRAQYNLPTEEELKILRDEEDEGEDHLDDDGVQPPVDDDGVQLPVDQMTE